MVATILPMYNFSRIKVLITSACNANCTHCFRNKDKNTYSIPFDKLREIVDFGIKYGCQQFSFSGGEFFTHQHAYDLINYCINKGVHIGILTNGLDVDRMFFRKIQKKHLVTFQVSVDGLRENHDTRRGEGSFERMMTTVKNLYEIGYEVSAKIAIDEKNYRDIVEIFKMPWFGHVLVIPVAFSRDKVSGQSITESYREAERCIQVIYRNQAALFKNDRRCECYPHELAIKYDGGVYPCTEAREHNEFLIGNILNTSIEGVIRSYESDNPNKFICPEAQNSGCNACSAREICNRGCRLRALRFHGDILAPDPFNCRIFKDEYLEIPIGQLFWGENSIKGITS